MPTISPSTPSLPGLPSVAGASASAASLTPEGILLTTQRRLQDLDRQIGNDMRALEDNTHAAEELSRRQQALQELRNEVGNREGFSTEDGVRAGHLEVEVDGVTYDLDALCERFGLDKDRLHNEGEFVTIGAIDGALEVVKQQSRLINSGNEMRMLSIQTLTQQRTQVIQVATSLLAKIHEGEQAVSRNI